MGSLPWFSYCIRLWKQRVYFSKPSRKFAVWELLLKSKPWAGKQKVKVSGSIYGRFGLLKAWKPCLLGRKRERGLEGHSRPSGLSHLCSLPLLWTTRGIPLPTLPGPSLLSRVPALRWGLPPLPTSGGFGAWGAKVSGPKSRDLPWAGLGEPLWLRLG